MIVLGNQKRKPSESTPQQLQKLAIKIAGEGQLRITVTGNSMQPSMLPGDALLVDSHLRQDLAVGQIVTFLNDDVLVTHRIVMRKHENFVLKGDNAPAFDPPVGTKQIVGRVIAVEHGGTWRAVRTTFASRAVARLSRWEGTLHRVPGRFLKTANRVFFRVLIHAAVRVLFKPGTKKTG